MNEKTHEKITTPYLIQRMKFCRDPISTTFDGYLELDYMGSSEFEWGALPASLKLMCRAADDLVIAEVPEIKDTAGQTLHVVAMSEEDAKAYREFLPGLVAADRGDRTPLTDSIRLKEPTFICRNQGLDWGGKPLSPDREWLKFHAWWDIVNEVMFTFGWDNAAKLVAAIKATRDMKRKAKAAGWY